MFPGVNAAARTRAGGKPLTKVNTIAMVASKDSAFRFMIEPRFLCGLVQDVTTLQLVVCMRHVKAMSKARIIFNVPIREG